jgi:hypothetical protein
VYADDTIYPALEVTELTPGRTTGVVTLRSTVFNQRRELVLEGLQKFLAAGLPSRNGQGRHAADTSRKLPCTKPLRGRGQSAGQCQCETAREAPLADHTSTRNHS